MSKHFLSPSRFTRTFSLARFQPGLGISFSQPRHVSEVGALWADDLGNQLAGQVLSPSREPQFLALSRHEADFQTIPEGSERNEWLQMLSGSCVPPGAFAYNYGGHQFGSWAGQLGDGRALVLGEAELNDGSRVELQLKGSGKTPFSRRGDGLAVLRSSLREFLMSEAMFALGVPTSRALSLVLTGDRVLRDRFYDGRPEFEPGALVCRTAPTFLRLGNFELLAERGQTDELRRLIRFSAAEFYDLVSPQEEMCISVEFVQAVSARSAMLVAAWQSLGFVHGVLNTDNMSLVGVTLDYGPFGFMDEFDPRYTPNTSDLPGRRYCYANQPGICRWNVAMFAQAVGTAFGWSRFVAGELEDSPIVQAALATFDEVFQREIMHRWQNRLGYTQQPENQAAQMQSVNALLRLLQKYRLDPNYLLREYAEALRASDKSIFVESMSHYGRILLSEDSTRERQQQWISGFLDDWRCWMDGDIAIAGAELTERGKLMCDVNPRFVLHNHLLAKISDRLARKIEQANNAGIAQSLDEEMGELLAALYSPFDDSDFARKLSVPLGPLDRRLEDCLNSCSS